MTDAQKTAQNLSPTQRKQLRRLGRGQTITNNMLRSRTFSQFFLEQHIDSEDWYNPSTNEPVKLMDTHLRISTFGKRVLAELVN